MYNLSVMTDPGKVVRRASNNDLCFHSLFLVIRFRAGNPVPSQ